MRRGDSGCSIRRTSAPPLRVFTRRIHICKDNFRIWMKGRVLSALRLFVWTALGYDSLDTRVPILVKLNRGGDSTALSGQHPERIANGYTAMFRPSLLLPPPK